ncbi:MAG: DUF3455 domain-containing protein [Betaproteobacteria bacterium]
MTFASQALRLTPFVAVSLLAACAGVTMPRPPSVVVPESLRAPAGESLLRTLQADGVQIYECRAKEADASAAEWVFVAPEARLVDDQGTLVGRHYAGPTWEAGDGSKVVGTVRAKIDAPQAGTIPWLLLATRSTGKPGLFAKVSSIQRVATSGGAMPATGCDKAAVGQVARVPYKAEYAQYAPTL